jgi:hypothetical protein
MQMTAAWVRRKRYEAGLLAQALYFGTAAPVKPKAKEPDFWEMLTTAQGVHVVNVEAGGNGDQAG